MNPLDRYEPLVDDYEAFRDACDRALPSVVRVNGIKADRSRVRAALDREGVAYEEVGWHDRLFRLPDGSPGTNWPYVHGWLQGQEEVSALPAIALDPDPGDTVLDSCAAPGSKTCHLADLMDDSGTLVANDNNLGRISALRHNAERLGVSNVVVTNRDARTFAFDGVDAFDGVVADVPCSCEGTCRKNPDALENWTMGHVESLVGVQKGILRRAVQLTRPGGEVVYSTCTFAPEENEGVVDHVLGVEDCELVEWDAPLETTEGITAWQDEEYDDSLRKAHRVYPQFNDTGGFFVAKLRVGGDEEPATDGGVDAADADDDSEVGDPGVSV
jgi:NOL1/NOP2/sun family putative RNA methylase